MVKYRYLWLFVFGYVIGGENEGKNSISLDISRSTQQYTLKTMPDHIFEENLNIFKNITGYEVFESISVYDESLQQLALEYQKQPLNTKNINNNKSKKKKNRKKSNNNNSQTQVSKQNLTKKIISLQMNQQPSNTKSNKNKKNKKKNKKNNNDDQILDKAIEKNKKELWEKKEERTFTDDVNDMVLSYQLYKQRSLDPEFNDKRGPLLLSFLDIVGVLLDEKELTKKEQRIKKEELLPLYEKIKQESFDFCAIIEKSSFDDEN